MHRGSPPRDGAGDRADDPLPRRPRPDRIRRPPGGPGGREGTHGVRLGAAPEPCAPLGPDGAPAAPAQHAVPPDRGYAGAFNRRHKRVGHLFQNRYKSIVVEEEPYLLELVRYLHLNPVRAKVVPDCRRLDRFPWTGHSALLGTVPRAWQETASILAQFGPS